MRSHLIRNPAREPRWTVVAAGAGAVVSMAFVSRSWTCDEATVCTVVDSAPTRSRLWITASVCRSGASIWARTGALVRRATRGANHTTHSTMITANTAELLTHDNPTVSA